MPARSNVTPISDRTLLPRSLIKRPPQGAEQHWMLAGWLNLVTQMEALGEAGAPREDEVRVVEAMDGLRTVFASTTPKMPSVAILQLCIAIGELDAFDAGWIAHPDGDRMITLIKSLVSNALCGMEDATGLRRDRIGGDYVAGRRDVTCARWP